MDKLFLWIVEHKKTVLIFFAVSSVLCFFLSRGVRVNYNMVDYLPEDSPSTVALDVMAEEFDSGVPNARLLAPEVTIPEALVLKEKLSTIDGVEEVLWLDDVTSVEAPLDMLDQKVLEGYYKDRNALFSLTMSEDNDVTIEAFKQIRELVGEGCALSGMAVTTAEGMSSATQEIAQIMVIVVILCLAILMLTTNSWIEPVLFMVTIGAAILLNMGTNLMFGEISFVTNSAGSILQLAVSMDYSIFLLHRFAYYRKSGMNVRDAMVQALKKAVVAISSSGLTTVIGFAALILMKFKIGPDMGIVMAKAILLSMLSVLVLLPVLTLYCYKLIDKLEHRPLMPKFQKFSDRVVKIRVPAIALLLVLMIPSALAQGKNEFLYGSSQIFGKDTPAYAEAEKIEEEFGRTNMMAILVPRGDFVQEKALSSELKQIPEVSSILSFVDNAGPEIPPEYLDAETRAQLLSPHYSRIVLTLDCPYEGEQAFAVVDEVRDAVRQSYPTGYHLAGDTVNAQDLKVVVNSDTAIVNFIAILAVFLVLVISLKSLVLPVVLVLVIEVAIWVNLSVPYFTGDPLFYLAYLIISSVQLGATVDYAILMATRYLEERQTRTKERAIRHTVWNTTLSILTSGSILLVGGAMIGLICTNVAIQEIGVLLARGAGFSVAMVLLVLPGLLYSLDGIIKKTTLKANFYEEKEKKA